VLYSELNNIEDGVEEALEQRVLYARDETEVTSTSGAYTEVKNHRMIRSSHYGMDVKEIFVIAEIKTTGGSGIVGVFVDSDASPIIRFSTTSSSYGLHMDSATVSWTDDTLHDISVRTATDGSGTMYNRTYEMFVRRW
jgi:hypothetical protein